MISDAVAAPERWLSCYRGLVRASFHHPSARPPETEAHAIVAELETRVGRKLRGAGDYEHVVLPAFLGNHGLEVITRGPAEIEYRWKECLCPDLVACSSEACFAGMQFHEEIARVVVPGLIDFRPLEVGADGECRVLIVTGT